MFRWLVFEKNNLPQFFNLLAGFGKVNAPVKVSDQSYAFRQVTGVDQIAFEALRTILPPKKFFYPQKEVLITYTDGEIREENPVIEPLVLFGVHPCDLAGLGIMDTIFSSQPADTHYQQRREKTLIVGLSCMPDKHCFCQSMGTDCPTKGYDLFLTDIGDHFFLEVNTPLAMKVLEPGAGMRPADPDDCQKYKEFWQSRSQSFVTGFDSHTAPAAIELEWNNQAWEELGSRCLSCGNCTPVCPTCYCFDLVDVASLTHDAGQRHREWDSCQFVGFAKVAGDFNFRPSPVDRLKFWYRHKLHGFDDAYGMPTCVGCGRCTVSCPAGIDDLVGLVLKLQGQAQGSGVQGGN